ncbi:hypothetical protein [Falsiruegeria mediterranea]
MTPEIILVDLPAKLRRQRALITAEGVAAGEAVAEARDRTQRAMRRVYRRWLADLEETDPRCAPAARHVLKKEGLI